MVSAELVPHAGRFPAMAKAGLVELVGRNPPPLAGLQRGLPSAPVVKWHDLGLQPTRDVKRHLIGCILTGSLDERLVTELAPSRRVRIGESI